MIALILSTWYTKSGVSFKTGRQPITKYRNDHHPIVESIMTPAVNLLKNKRIPYALHQYDHDASVSSYGKEAAEKLQLDPKRVFKTLVVELDQSRLGVAIIPVPLLLNMKQIAKAAKSKKAAMADKGVVERTTGYILGGVSPLGQKKKLPTFIDESARTFPTIFVSGGRRGLDIELAPTDLATLTTAKFAPLTS